MANYSLNTPYLLLGGLVIIALVLMFLQYQPLIVQINETRSDITSLRNSVAERQVFLATIDRKRAELVTYQEHEHRLDVMLPQKGQVEDVVRVVHAANQATGGNLVRFVNQSEGAKRDLNAERARGELVTIPETVQPLAATVQWAGSYSQLRAFLEQLTRSARLIDVIHLTISSAANQSDALQMEASLRFYQLSSQ